MQNNEWRVLGKLCSIHVYEYSIDICSRNKSVCCDLFRVSLVQVIKLLAPIEPQRKRHFLDKKWLILLSLFMIDISTVTETFDLICLSHFTVEH